MHLNIGRKKIMMIIFGLVLGVVIYYAVSNRNYAPIPTLTGKFPPRASILTPLLTGPLPNYLSAPLNDTKLPAFPPYLTTLPNLPPSLIPGFSDPLPIPLLDDSSVELGNITLPIYDTQPGFSFDSIINSISKYVGNAIFGN